MPSLRSMQVCVQMISQGVPDFVYFSNPKTSSTLVKIKFVKDRPGNDLRYALNSNKIKKQLKWRPLRNFKSGLKETFIWYYENDKFFENFSKNFLIFFRSIFL